MRWRKGRLLPGLSLSSRKAGRGLLAAYLEEAAADAVANPHMVFEQEHFSLVIYGEGKEATLLTTLKRKITSRGLPRCNLASVLALDAIHRM